MTTIQLRRATASAWSTVNPVLALGEAGVETDSYKIKVGDGVSLWNDLPYFVHSWADVTGKPAVIAAGADKAAARSAIDAASLDANGKVPISELPNSIMVYQGVWDAATNTPTLLDGSGNVGDVYRVSVSGDRNLGSGSISFTVGDYVIFNSDSVWEKSDTTDAVATVAGRTGNVVLTAADVDGALTADGAATLTNKTLGSSVTGQVADICLVAFGASTAREAGTGDNPFGVKLQRDVTFSAVTYRAATADASGNLVVELRKNGVAVAGSSATIAAASQVAGGTVTGSWAFAAGDVLTVEITAVGTGPGDGLVADIEGLTA